MLKRNSFVQNHGGDFNVICDGRDVGRIFDKGPYLPSNMRWFWGVEFHQWRGCPRPQYGTAPDREAAMAAFKTTWISCVS
jgi:hypothetical protein